MGTQKKEALMAEIEVFKAEMLKSYVIKAWADSYVNTDPFSYTIFEDENNKIWWMKAQTYELWQIWQAAKTKAVPNGYRLVKNPKPLVGNEKVDFSQAPEWAKFWLKDGYSNKYWWSNIRPKLDLDIGCFVFPSNYKALEAPDFGFNGDWTKSITSRKAMVA